MDKRTQAEWSLVGFALYLLGLGILLVSVPNLVLGVFGMPETDEPFIRIVGLLAIILAYYYWRILRARFAPFYRWTVHTRVFVLPFFGALVALDLAPAPILLIGVAELGFTSWTWLALRAERAGSEAAAAPGA